MAAKCLKWILALQVRLQKWILCLTKVKKTTNYLKILIWITMKLTKPALNFTKKKQKNQPLKPLLWIVSTPYLWNNVNVPLVVQNKDNIFTSSVIRSQKILICHHNLTRSLRSLFRLFGDISIFLLTHSFSRENIIFIFHHSWHIVTVLRRSLKCVQRYLRHPVCYIKVKKWHIWNIFD